MSELYLVTFNCARALADPQSLAPTFFDALPKEAPVPDLIAISLQEVAPIAYSFLGGSYLKPYFDRITSTPKADAVALATKLIEGTSGPFQPEKMPNEFANAVREFVQAKVEQRPPEVAPAPDGKAPKVINIMAALKESVQAKGRAKVREAVRKRSGKSAASPAGTKRKPSRDQRRSIH